MKTHLIIVFLTLCLSCSSIKYSIKKDLPVYKTEHTFEYAYARVWTATYNVIASNADIEIAEENDGIIKTAWNIETSDIDFAEYKLNDQTQRKPLQLRYRYTVRLERITGGIKVKIDSEQEYEKLNPEDFETPSNTWVSTKSSTAREHQILEQIKTELLK